MSDDNKQPKQAKSKTEPPHEDAARLDELQAQVSGLTEALQRERADATNLRRRHQEELQGLKTFATSQVVQELLPVIDNFERALKHVPADLQGNDYIKGVQGIVKQFEATLGELGVTRIKTVGEPFDPKLHEAISMEAGDGTTETVSEEVQAGYTLGDTVLRHAMVKVKA